PRFGREREPAGGSAGEGLSWPPLPARLAPGPPRPPPRSRTQWRARRSWRSPWLTAGAAGEPIRLVDERGDAGTIVDADGRPSAAPEVIQRVAQRGQSDRFPRLSRFGLVAFRGGESQRAVAERQDRVAPGDLPLTIGPVTRERVADLDRAEHPPLRADENGRVIFHRLAESAPAQLGSRHFRILASEEEEEIQPVKAQVSQTPSAGNSRIEHPGSVPGWIARRRRPVLAHIDVGERTESPVGQELAGADDEWLIALTERDGNERVGLLGLLGHAADFLRIDAHRLFHQERIAAVEEIVRRRRHAVRRSQRDHEVRSSLREHLEMISEDRRVAELPRSVRHDCRTWIMESDELDVGETEGVSQVRGVPQRVPVAHADGRDPQHYALSTVPACMLTAPRR